MARILVTGGTGFVGSHLVELLLKRQETVIVLGRSIDPRSYFYRQKLDKRVILVDGDLKDRQRIFDIVSKYEITTIIHLGAQPIVTTAYVNPVETIESNILGTTYILEAARLVPTVARVIVASSDKAYGKSVKPYVETDPLRGDHPYEVSKSAADLIAQTYWQTYGVPVVVTRFGNIFGPGDLNPSRIIPGMMQAIARKEKLLLRSDGTFVRDYVYVADVARAYAFLLDNFEKIKGEAFNIAAGNAISVLGLIKMTEKILKKKISYEITNTAKNEIRCQELSWQKIKKLGWRPKYLLRQGLLATWKWQQKFG